MARNVSEMLISRPLLTAFAALTLVGAAVLTGCVTPHPPGPWHRHDFGPQAGFATGSGFSYWQEQRGNGPLRVTIDLSDQAAYFDRGTVRVGQSRVATGLPGYSTPTGSYTITEKAVEKRSTLYGQIQDRNGTVVKRDADSRKDPIPDGGRFVGAEMPYWMRLTSSGIGMHAGPIPNPGHPASHGCIRMPPEMASSLHHKVEIGTQVDIVP